MHWKIVIIVFVRVQLFITINCACHVITDSGHSLGFIILEMNFGTNISSNL